MSQADKVEVIRLQNLIARYEFRWKSNQAIMATQNRRIELLEEELTKLGFDEEKLDQIRAIASDTTT